MHCLSCSVLSDPTDTIALQLECVIAILTRTYLEHERSLVQITSTEVDLSVIKIKQILKLIVVMERKKNHITCLEHQNHRCYVNRVDASISRHMVYIIQDITENCETNTVSISALKVLQACSTLHKCFKNIKESI